MRYALSRFRQAKTAEEEVNLVQNALSKSTQYKNKWAIRRVAKAVSGKSTLCRGR